MKKIGLIIGAILLTTSVFSQVETEKKNEVKVEREVKVTEENGIKTVEVTTIEPNGEVRYESFTGAAADKKLAEIRKEEAQAGAKVQRTEERKKVMKTEKSVESTPAVPLEEQRMD